MNDLLIFTRPELDAQRSIRIKTSRLFFSYKGEYFSAQNHVLTEREVRLSHHNAATSQIDKLTR